VNHVFSGLTGNREWADFTHFRELFPGLETRNGQLMPFCNRKAELLAERWRKASIAGSDAHTLSTLGRTFTEVQGARSKTEFLEAVRHRRAQVRGISGNYVQLTLAIATIGFHFLRHSPWGIAALPLLPAVPLATLASCTRDLLLEPKTGVAKFDVSTRPGGNMISSMLEALVANDLKLMRRVHRWPAPRWIRV
jgi:PHP-associated